MPQVRIYIRAEAWKTLLKECHGDPAEAQKKVARMVHERYG